MKRYPLVSRLLHWLSAIVVVGVLGLGLTLGILHFDGAKETFGLPVTSAIYKYHKSLGIVVLALMTLRLLFRLFIRKPPYDSPLPRVNRITSSLVHGLIYVLLLIQPILGWAATAAGGFPIEFFNWQLPKLIGKDAALSTLLYHIHFANGLLLLVLITVHVTSALFHRLAVGDTVMRRISLF